MKTITAKIATTCLAVIAFAATASAEVSTIKDALGVALKNETIAAGGEKMKLYSANAYTSGTRTYWSFQFYDSGANLHSVRVDGAGKASYSSRDKGSMSVFDDLDFSKLPAPSEVLVEGAMEKAKAALVALGFKPTNSGKYQISYYVRSEYRQKDTPVHDFKVSLPTGDGKAGKMVGFKNGSIDTIMNSSIRD